MFINISYEIRLVSYWSGLMNQIRLWRVLVADTLDLFNKDTGFYIVLLGCLVLVFKLIPSVVWYSISCKLALCLLKCTVGRY